MPSGIRSLEMKRRAGLQVLECMMRDVQSVKTTSEEADAEAVIGTKHVGSRTIE